MRSVVNLLVAIAALATAACSIHPLPDDVAFIPTEEIVKSARCETKLAVYERIRYELDKRGIAGIAPDTILEKPNLDLIRRHDNLLAFKIEAYSASAIAYTFEFLITEDDNAEASAGFKLPFTKGTFDMGIAGKLQKSRQGLRRFESLETFADLTKLDCDGFDVRYKNIVYPVSGSIGLRQAMSTFIELAELGSGKGNFTDTLIFTTKISGEISPKLVLNPVPKTMRLVSLEGKLSADRTDMHKVTVSFAFPAVDLRKPHVESFGDAPRERVSALSHADFRALSDDTLRRAVENLCVARALDRENAFGTLRLNPPEYYCRGGRNAL
jgi:hypothetical protein